MFFSSLFLLSDSLICYKRHQALRFFLSFLSFVRLYCPITHVFFSILFGFFLNEINATLLFRMSSNAVIDAVQSTFHTVFKKYLLTILRTIVEYLIAFLTVQIPIFCHYVGRLGKADDLGEKQKRVRAKLTSEEDPSSPYRAVEVLDKLRTQPERKVDTLAAIPELCLQRHADKETMGVREISDVQEEKQANGKVYKKVCWIDWHFRLHVEIFS